MLPQIKKILYATDLSKNAQYAFSYAISMAKTYDAKITILHAVEESSFQSVSMVADYLGEAEWQILKKNRRKEVEDEINKRLKEYSKKHDLELSGSSGVCEKTILKGGNPATVILNEAKNEYDMVIMGTHGHCIFEDALLGNTARRVIRLCQKPVLVIRIPED